MNALKEYINTFPRSERRKVRKEIAKSAGISESYVYTLSSGKNKIPSKMCVRLENATGGHVKRWQMCPYLYEETKVVTDVAEVEKQVSEEI